MVKQESGATQSKKELLWRERLARFTASGRKVAEFCNSEAVSEASFYRWRKRLPVPVDASRSSANWAPSTSASSRVCWPPAGCTISIRMTTSSTSCNLSTSIRRRWCVSSRHGSGKSFTLPTRCARICTTYENASQVNNAGWLPLTHRSLFREPAELSV
jgi:hypothetical protein